MSSLASVLVAKANATPEKVVPYAPAHRVSAGKRKGEGEGGEMVQSHKIYAHDELRLVLVLRLDLDGPPAGRIVTVGRLQAHRGVGAPVLWRLAGARCGCWMGAEW
jgi:hypothetical protein